MKIEEHIFHAINAADRNETEHALLHATIAVDGTSRKLFNSSKSSRSNYVKFIRDYYWLIEPMIGGGINFDDTRWNKLDIQNIKGMQISDKDLASVIYHVFRCTQAHGTEIPNNYKLLPRNSDGTLSWLIANNQLQMPETIIWALISLCVFCKANHDIKTGTNHFLTLGENKFHIADWWGLEKSLKPLAMKYNPTRVKITGF